jgi:aryl-alcohol dehydrogenase-like predicted oxidoreductase
MLFIVCVFVSDKCHIKIQLILIGGPVMKYANLGNTGLKVSKICLGAMNYGDPVSETEATKIVKSAIGMGVNFFDTSDGYFEGKSEEILGKALKGDRQTVVIATKVCGRTGPGANDIGLSRAHVMQAVDKSLKRLQTDYIDLYYAHSPDYETPIEETLGVMDDLVHQGKVRYIGCSNFSAWQLCKARGLSALHGWARFECVQPPYNLLTRDIDMEMLPLCAEDKIGVCTYNPLAGEMLTGKHEFGKPPAEGRFTHKIMGPGYMERYWSDINFKAVDKIKQLAADHGCSLVQFAIGWILNNPTITSVLSGTTAIEQLEENISATEIKLSSDELKACDEVWRMFRPPRYHYAKTLEDIRNLPVLKSK